MIVQGMCCLARLIRHSIADFSQMTDGRAGVAW